MKSKRRWLLLIFPLTLFAWAYQAASWRPKLVGVSSNLAQGSSGFGPRQLELLVSPNGTQLASYGRNSYQGSFGMWAPQSRRQLWQQKTEHEIQIPLAFSPDGQILIAASYRIVEGRPLPADIYRVEATTGKRLNLLKTLIQYGFSQHDLKSAAFLSNQELVMSSDEGAVVVDSQTGKMIRGWKFDFPVLPNTSLPRYNQSHISDDGTTVIALANGIYDTAIVIYDAQTGKQRAVWTYNEVFRNPRLSPDATLWAMQSQVHDSGDLVDVYDSKTGQKLWGPFAVSNYGNAWAWSADSKRIVTVVGGIQNLDARTGRNLGQVSTSGGIQSLALDPRGDYFYTLDKQGKIWRWRLR